MTVSMGEDARKPKWSRRAPQGENKMNSKKERKAHNIQKTKKTKPVGVQRITTKLIHRKEPAPPMFLKTTHGMERRNAKPTNKVKLAVTRAPGTASNLKKDIMLS